MGRRATSAFAWTSPTGGYLITPTDACLGFLDPARLARLDANARQLSGDRGSKTIALHTEIYAAARAFDKETCCVIHTHSAHCVALTMKLPVTNCYRRSRLTS